MLTPEDIEQKTFSTALRGYDLNEVDDFLDEIMSTIRDLHEQLEAARAGSGVGGGAEVAAPATGVDEAAVGRALIAAQEAADRITAEAKDEAERIRAEARSDADTWISERESMRAEAEREMADLSGRVALVRRELAVLATGVADSLDKMDSVISDAFPADEPEASAGAARHAAPGADVMAADSDDDISWDTPAGDESPTEDSPEDESSDDESPDDTFDDSEDEAEEDESPDDDVDADSDEGGDNERVDTEDDDSFGRY